jgi:hypothetical protein
VIQEVIVSISVVLLLTVIVVLLVRFAGLRVWQALICVVLGFYLAGSTLAPVISSMTHDIASLISGH